MGTLSQQLSHSTDDFAYAANSFEQTANKYFSDQFQAVSDSDSFFEQRAPVGQEFLRTSINTQLKYFTAQQHPLSKPWRLHQLYQDQVWSQLHHSIHSP